MLGDLEASERHAERAVEFAESLGENRVLVETLGDLGFVQMLRRRESYRGTLDRALALEQEERGRRRAEDEDTFASWWMTDWQNAMTLAWAGDLDAARDGAGGDLLRRGGPG